MRFKASLFLFTELPQHLEWRMPKQVSHQNPSARNHRTTTMNCSHRSMHKPGKTMYLSHHRPDIQHSVNTLSRLMRNLTLTTMGRLKKLNRYMLGTRNLYQGFFPDPHAEILQVAVDSDWADDKETCQVCSG